MVALLSQFLTLLLQYLDPISLQRRFSYSDAGILDSTHLRFFVEQTAVELVNFADLRVTKGIVTGLDGPRSNLLDRLSFGLLRHHLAKQYVMRGELIYGGVVQEKVRWRSSIVMPKTDA